MIQSLPPGLWDNPQPHELQAYQEFVTAWFADEDAYREHYQQWVADEELGEKVLSVRMLAYDACGTCNPAGGTDTQTGGFAVLYPLSDNSSDIGTTTWYNYGEGSSAIYPTCGLFGWGEDFAITLTEDIELPKSKMDLLPKPNIPLMERKAKPHQVATAQHPQTVSALWGYENGRWAYPGWLKFDTSEIPNAIINYAFIRIWPLENYSDSTATDVCISLANGLPEDQHCGTQVGNAFLFEYVLSTTNLGKLWTNTEATWNVGTPVDTPNIACLIEESKTLPSGLELLFDPRPVFESPPHSSSYRLAASVELHIYYEETYSLGGVVVNGRAKYEDIGGVLVSGSADEDVRWGPTPRGGAIVNGRPPLYLQYKATGGVVIQRPTVELHLDCENPDDAIVEDISSWERDATLVNMDSNNFVNERTGKVLDFDIEV